MTTGEPHHGVFALAQESFSPHRRVPVAPHWHGVEQMDLIPERQTTQYSQVSFARRGDYDRLEEQREGVAEESESPSFDHMVDAPTIEDLNRGLAGKRPRSQDYENGHAYPEGHHIASRELEKTRETQDGRDRPSMDMEEELGSKQKKRQHTKPLTITDLLLANGIALDNDSDSGGNSDHDNNIDNGPIHDIDGEVYKVQGLVDSDKDGLATRTWQHKWRGRITNPLTYAELFLANGIAFKGSDDQDNNKEEGGRNGKESLSGFTTRCGRKTQPPKRFRRSGPKLARTISEP